MLRALSCSLFGLLMAPLVGHCQVLRPAPRVAVRPVSTGSRLAKWRVNDTLTLECSRPCATLITEDQPTPQTIWGQIALRGRRGSYRVLETHTYWTLYHAAVTPQGDLFQLATVDVDAFPVRARAKPLKLAESDLAYNTYDVRYQTWTEYLAQDLSALPAQQIEAAFLGGEANDGLYYPLPYWLAQEQARVLRTHHLPPAAQFEAYLELSQDTTAHTGRLGPAYRPLLAKLLRTYQAYPLPPATASRLAQAVRSLETAAPAKY